MAVVIGITFPSIFDMAKQKVQGALPLFISTMSRVQAMFVRNTHPLDSSIFRYYQFGPPTWRPSIHYSYLTHRRKDRILVE